MPRRLRRPCGADLGSAAFVQHKKPFNQAQKRALPRPGIAVPAKAGMALAE